MAPAALPSVLAVGADDVRYSSIAHNQAGSAAKPDLWCPSQMTFGAVPLEGTSLAAAVCAGAIAAYWSALDEDEAEVVMARVKAAADAGRRLRLPLLP